MAAIDLLVFGPFRAAAMPGNHAPRITPCPPAWSRTVLYTPEFGLRWATGVAVRKDGVEPFSDKIRSLIDL